MHSVATTGSLRSESFSRAAYTAATSLVPGHVTLVEAPIVDIPLFNQDVEAAGDPQPVLDRKTTVDAADGLIIFTPEYNHSIPAVTKNAVDWLSRRRPDSVLSRSPVGIIATTPSEKYTGADVLAHLSHSIASITPHLFSETLGIGSAENKTADGALIDDQTRRDLAAWLAGFVAHAEAARHA
ncbi:MAG: NAD(P)H-dependent oxidoreductase [Acidimicrobiia bacterium]|nr:NAD(P)H-dependent oxidoreductase [Acidimicrobiia bacterium]